MNGNDQDSGPEDKGATVVFSRRSPSAVPPTPAIEEYKSYQDSSRPAERDVYRIACNRVECFDCMSLGWLMRSPVSIEQTENGLDIEGPPASTDHEILRTRSHHVEIDTGWSIKATKATHLLTEPLNHPSPPLSIFPVTVSAGDSLRVRVPQSGTGSVERGEALCHMVPLGRESGPLDSTVRELQEEERERVIRGERWITYHEQAYVNGRRIAHSTEVVDQ